MCTTRLDHLYLPHSFSSFNGFSQIVGLKVCFDMPEHKSQFFDGFLYAET